MLGPRKVITRNTAHQLKAQALKMDKVRQEIEEFREVVLLGWHHLDHTSWRAARFSQDDHVKKILKEVTMLVGLRIRQFISPSVEADDFSADDVEDLEDFNDYLVEHAMYIERTSTWTQLAENIQEILRSGIDYLEGKEEQEDLKECLDIFVKIN